MEEAEEQEAVGGTADIKSNNPHLTGGEKPYTNIYLYMFNHIPISIGFYTPNIKYSLILVV